jgi:hypothetical protein
MYSTLGPPVMQLDKELKPILVGWEWLNWDSPPPPSNWQTPEFEDSTWLRAPAGRAVATRLGEQRRDFMV